MLVIFTLPPCDCANRRNLSRQALAGNITANFNSLRLLQRGVCTSVMSISPGCDATLPLLRTNAAGKTVFLVSPFLVYQN